MYKRQALPESPEEPYLVSCLFHNSDSHRRRTWNGDSVSQEISERFGVELEPVNSGIQYESTVKLLVASDSLPDILELQRDHVFSWLVRERKLWNLGPSIQKYGGYAAMAVSYTHLDVYKRQHLPSFGQSHVYLFSISQNSRIIKFCE